VDVRLSHKLAVVMDKEKEPYTPVEEGKVIDIPVVNNTRYEGSPFTPIKLVASCKG
jgi:hypothetical protein